MALQPHFRPRNWCSRLAAGLGRKAAELVTVFVGVYDPVTKHLRPAYSWYGEFAGQMVTKYAELRPQVDRVLQQLKVERTRNC